MNRARNYSYGLEGKLVTSISGRLALSETWRRGTVA
jgi:hypothetical protein